MDTNSSVISLQTSLEPRHRRIKALKLDTSAPIKDSALTLVGRVIRVTLDVFKPLEKESIFDFSSGEEQVILLEYEGLDRHCSECHSLLLSESHCALRKFQPRQTARTTQAHPSQTHSPRSRRDTSREHSFSQPLSREAPPVQPTRR
ncbi:hypothetical protein YC2023_082993 [Brassica napus]